MNISRSHDPIFSISTDIIVGFPGDRGRIQVNRQGNARVPIRLAYIARYSPQSGTRATDTMEDDISAEEKARRWSILNDILRNRLQIDQAPHRKRRSTHQWRNGDGNLSGRTRNFKEIYIPTIRISKKVIS
ncbi:hypothetical protein H6769_06540 [Candidatus Peribacteria bacterium]|nr:hypothetical protein [Candidatus Peribacteria bacterium]